MALLGQNVSLECCLDPLVRNLIWKQGNGDILIHQKLQRNTSITIDKVHWHSEVDVRQLRSKLIIKQVQYNNSGTYSCLQYFEMEATKVSEFRLQVQGYPHLSIKPNISVENNTIVASCCLESSANKSEVDISWALSNKHIALSSTITTRNEQRNSLVTYCADDLYIFVSRYIHGTTLTCITGNKVNLSASVVLDIQYPATVKMRTTNSVAVFNMHCGLLISCESDGNPRPDVTIQKKSSNEKWNTLLNKLNITSKNGKKVTLVTHLKDTCRGIRGRYRCLASNTIETTLFTDSVEVLYEFPKMNYAMVLLMLILAFIVVYILMKVLRKRRKKQYDSFLEATRRHKQRITDNFVTLTRSLRRGDNNASFPDTFRSTTTLGEPSARDHISKNEDQGYKMAYATSIKQSKDTLPLQEGSCTIESDRKYTTLN